MRGVGPIDERGRLALVGSGMLGAAVGFSAVFLFTRDAGGPPSLITGVGLPAAVVGAGIGVVVLLATWRRAGGYLVVTDVRRWIKDRRVPVDVPASDWVPKLEREAERHAEAVGRVFLSAVIIALQAAQVAADHAPGRILSSVMIAALWSSLAAWQLLVSIPRAKRAASMLARGVHDREASTDGSAEE